jgi:hypothetical protein
VRFDYFSTASSGDAADITAAGEEKWRFSFADRNPQI